MTSRPTATRPLPKIFRRLRRLSIAANDIAFKDTSAAYGVRTLPVTW